MPAFNVGPWIGEALASVLAQTHNAWTAYVIDDGSTDDTAEVVGLFADPRIRLIRQANAGVSAARNRGLALARGEAVLFLDADDVLAPDALARLTRVLARRPRAIASAGRFRFFPDQPGGDRFARIRADGDGIFARIRADAGAGFARIRALLSTPRGDLLPSVLERNPFANGGHVLVRREAAERAGGFRPALAYGEDWVFWTRVAQLGRFAAAGRGGPMLAVRQRAGSAYQRMATDPAAFRPCMEAIFADPGLAARFGVTRLVRFRRRAEMENAWIVGRELVRHGRVAEGRRWLRRSVAAKPSLRRAVLLAAAHALPLLPRAVRGPFRPYAAASG